MGFPWRQTIFFLVIVIAILQVIHISLLSRLEALKNERRKRNAAFKFDKIGHDNPLVYSIKEIEKDRKLLLDAVKESSVLDAFGEMHIINNWIKAESLGNRNHIRKDITLVTQSSLSELYNLLTIIHRWKGLISVGLFTLTRELSIAIEIILSLRKCYPMIRYNTSFHLVYPLLVPLPDLNTHYDLIRLLPSEPSAPSLSSSSRAESIEENICAQLPKIMTALNPGTLNYENEGIPFPNNLLRNVARRNSLTQFVFVIDIDLVPNNNLNYDFIEFAKENRLFEEETKDEKTIFVVPSYEIDSSLVPDHIPKDKTELMLAVNSGYVRPFYYELCWKCQKYTDYEAWQKEPLSPKLDILFEVFWHDPWEPFYISRNTVPMYDERFRQYGFNRISQVCELHMAGYRFSVLNNPFVIHKGMKRPDSFHKDKDLELEKNRILFRHFKNELKDRYRTSSRRCY
ncbi:beta-1,4-glucuronyltransferase 1 [Tetranychus urticae]|uniref:Beta-1,4-glucuronyltransferase 1 n=1 Tax=Tetranychus urticae TaxID=32264 RepID=T1K982_TETUR|nr:beta-1,4-glucuronyltransferase 1 [Tetranychus urticae]